MKMKGKEKRGISLIVLVITIIIMIILAAAVILSLNSSNVVNKATEAKGKSDIANARNVVAMATAEWELMSDTEKAAEPYNNSFSEYAKTKLTSAGFTVGSTAGAYEVTNKGEVNVYPKIPDGFRASIYAGENTVAGGLVIYETISVLTPDAGIDTTNRDTARTTYNQYVWIPVEGEVGLYDWSQQKASLDWWSMGPIGFIKTFAETMPDEISNSIKSNGGFYIARYEAGKPIGDALTGGTTTGLDIDGTDKPVSIKGAIVWNNIPWDKDYTWGETGGSPENDGCAKVSKSLTTSAVESHLIYGAEWDAALKFLSSEKNVLDSTSWGNYSNNTVRTSVSPNNPANTGAHENWKAKNVYDMAGNVSEWTYEYSSRYDSRIVRGGYYSNYGGSSPAVNRDYASPGNGSSTYGFRVAICAK